MAWTDAAREAAAATRKAHAQGKARASFSKTATGFRPKVITYKTPGGKGVVSYLGTSVIGRSTAIGIAKGIIRK